MDNINHDVSCVLDRFCEDTWQNLSRDPEFNPYPVAIYFDLKQTELISHFIRDEDADVDGTSTDYENRQIKQKVSADPDRYIIMEIPDHGLRHVWFRAWLEEIGRLDDYFGTIGGFFKQYDLDFELRYAWQNHEREFSLQFALDQLRAAIKSRN